MLPNGLVSLKFWLRLLRIMLEIWEEVSNRGTILMLLERLKL